MADVTKTEYRGILIPDPRIKNANLDLTNSTFTQAGPKPGVADDTSSPSSNLVINTGGTQAVSGTLRIQAQGGGFSGKADTAGAFVWYDETSVAQLVIQDIRYDAVTAGLTGEDVTIAYTTGATAGAEVVTVTSSAISIQIETGVSTSAHIKTAFDLVAAAVALASCVDIGPSPALVQTGAVAAAALACPRMGYNSPVMVTGWDWLEFDEDGTSNTNTNFKDPSCVTLDNDIVLAAYHSDAIATGINTIGIQSFDPDTSVWTTLTSVDPETTGSSLTLSPSLLKLPSGRVLLYAWGPTVNAQKNIMMWYSDDAGVTFTMGSSSVLKNDLDTATYTAVGRIRAAYNTGQVCLVASTTKNGIGDVLIQWGSSDDGNNFIDVDIVTTTVITLDKFDLIALDTSSFMVAYIDSSNDLQSKNLGNAYDIIEDLTASAIDAVRTWTSVALYRYDSNKIAAVGMNTFSSEGALMTYNSVDNGDNWFIANASTALHTIDVNAGTVVIFTNLAASITRGMAVLPFKYTNTSGDIHINSLGVAYLGGSSSVTVPRQSVNQSIKTQMSWEQSFMGTHIPGSTGWTRTDNGGTRSYSTYGLTLTTTAASETYTTPTLGTTPTNGLLVWANLKVDSNDTASEGVFFNGILDEGTGGGLSLWGVTCSLTTTGFTLSDLNGGSSVEYADVLIDTTAGVEILIALNTTGLEVDGTFTYWYRVHGNFTNREWKQGQSSLVMQRNSTGISNTRVTLGHTSSTAVSHWKHVLASRLSYTEEVLNTGQTNPDDLIARHFSATSTTINGTSISATDGPVFKGDTWSIDTRYNYGIENLDTEIQPSPQIPWRSTGETAEEIIWLLNDQNTLTVYGQETLGIAFLNSNIIGYTLSGLNVDGTWTVITSPGVGNDNSVVTRYGNAFYMDSVSSNGTWYDYNELEGAYLQIDYAQNDTVYPRTISSNTGGHVTDSTAKRATIFFDGLDGNEPASGDTMKVVPLQSLTIMTAVAEYVGFKVIIDTNVGGTVNGYHEIGQIVIGPIEYFGTQYSHGREITVENNTELITRRDGTRYSKNLGKPRRKVAFSWDQGVDTSQIHGGTSYLSDYALPYAAADEAVAAPAGTPSQVQGILEYTKGSNKPVIYIPYIEASSSTKVYNSKRDMIYGRITSTSNISTVLGDENSDEVLRISTVEIEEEL